MSEYTGSQIEILEGLAPVRKRPGMYIGGTDKDGLHHLIDEIIDNSIDEHLAKDAKTGQSYCDTIQVTLNEDNSITITDNGRGIPIDIHPKLQIPTARTIFTILHAGGKFGSGAYKVSGGLHGVGASVVNALSSWLEVKIWRDGYCYRDRYENGGNPVVELTSKGFLPKKKDNSRKNGTSVTFLPDKTIFTQSIKFDSNVIKNRLQELAYLNKGLTIEFRDNRDGLDEFIVFKDERGIVGLVKQVNEGKPHLYEDVVYITGERETIAVIEGKEVKQSIEIEIAFQHTASSSTENIYAFCNNIRCKEQGEHVTGFKTALTNIIKQYIKDSKSAKNEDITGEDIRSGLCAVVSIKHPDPEFQGQTKTKLSNLNARTVTNDVFSTESIKYFDRNIDTTVQAIIDNTINAFNIRKKISQIKNNDLTSKFSIVSKDPKLADCQEKSPEKCEIFLVEGDSAGGTAKQGREKHYQAILSLKGKILNVEKSRLDKILKSEEIKKFILAMGTGICEEFDITKLRYHKIIILTDADVDGAHIRTLLLTLMFRYMKPLIDNGHVYIGVPPLYKVKRGKKEQYFITDAELNDFKEANKGKKMDIQRYKGLGEMNPEQLWDTTLNPETRTLKKVSIDDCKMADTVTTMLMGDAPRKRREFIEEQAVYANLDI